MSVERVDDDKGDTDNTHRKKHRDVDTQKPTKKNDNFENWHPVCAKMNHKFALSYLILGLSLAVAAQHELGKRNKTVTMRMPIDSYFQLECV